AVKLEDGQVVVQVVMNNDMEPDSIFQFEQNPQQCQAPDNNHQSAR
ncbi:hypothetical protein ACUOA8_39205, partial [Escherichia sp. SS-MK2]